MRALLALVFLVAACDQTPLDVPDQDQADLDGRWTSEWMLAGTDEQGSWSTRYVLVFSEDNSGFCTAQLDCECTRPENTPPTPGTHFWEGTRSTNYLTMQSTNLVTGDTGSLTATVGTNTMTVQFSWGETLTFTRASN